MNNKTENQPQKAADGAEITNDLEYILGDMDDYPLWSGVVSRAIEAINALRSQLDEAVRERDALKSARGNQS